MAQSTTSASQRQRALIQDALNARQSQNYARSFKLYNDAIALGNHGFLAEAYDNKGVLAMEQGDSSLALQCFLDAIATQPDYGKAWINLGNFYLENNKLDEALDAYEKAHALSPDHESLQFNKARTLNRLHRHHEASEILERFVTRDEKNNEIAIVPGVDSYRVYSELGLAALQTGEIKKALHFFRMSFNLESGDYQVCYHIAFIYDRLKDYEQALLFYDLTMALDPNEYKGFLGKATTLIHIKKYDDAIQYLAKAIDMAPDNFEPFYNLACVYAGLGESENTIKALRKALYLAPAREDLVKHIKDDPDLAPYLDMQDFRDLLFKI